GKLLGRFRLRVGVIHLEREFNEHLKVIEPALHCAESLYPRLPVAQATRDLLSRSRVVPQTGCCGLLFEFGDLAIEPRKVGDLGDIDVSGAQRLQAGIEIELKHDPSLYRPKLSRGAASPAMFPCAQPPRHPNSPPSEPQRASAHRS